MKKGHMKKNLALKVFALGLLLISAAFSTGSLAKDINDRDAFEKQYIKCFKEQLDKGCFEEEFSGALDFRIKDQDVVSKINESFLVWMKGQKIYDIYKVESQKKAQIYDVRTYLIEQESGNIMGVAVGFIRVAGEWRIFEMQVSNKHKFLQHILNLQDYTND